MNILKLILGILPVAEQVAVLFIHNPDSLHKYTVITGTVNEVAPVAIAVAEGALAATQAAPAA